MMDRPRLLPGLLLAALLIAAQSAFLVHAFELTAGSVDNPAPDATEPAAHVLAADADGGFDSLHTSTARQRGPPATI
jgi:hypothetical protein